MRASTTPPPLPMYMKGFQPLLVVSLKVDKFILSKKGYHELMARIILNFDKLLEFGELKNRTKVRYD